MNINIFKNNRKTSEKQPDYQSSFEVKETMTFVPGKKYKLAGWLKDGQGGKFISVKLTEDNYQGGGSPSHTQKNLGDEDIPF